MNHINDCPNLHPASSPVCQNQSNNMQYGSSPCKRYAYVSGLPAGFGHMFGQLVMGYVLSLESRSEFIIDAEIFNRDGGHGAYPWGLDFLGLSNITTLQSLGGVDRHVLTRWNDLATLHNSCDVIIDVCDQCCTNLSDPALEALQWCYYSKFGAFNLAKPFFRHMYTPAFNLVIFRQSIYLPYYLTKL